MRDYHLIIDGKALKKIKEMNVTILYIWIKYTKGPCNDNFCKLIPSVEISSSKPMGNILELKGGDIKIYAVDRIYNAIMKYGGDIIITYSSVKNRFQVKGIPYNF